MEIDKDITSILSKVDAGAFDHLSGQLEGGDLGIFSPAYVENGAIRMMKPGFTQTETDLKIEVTAAGLKDPKAKTIAWMGGGANAWSSCNHPGTGPHSCKHQNGHGDCIHCKGHNEPKGLGIPEGLDYHQAITQLDDKQSVLETLAPDKLGLTLLHAHSNQHEFTKLPIDMVSVIADGVTSFRKIQDVATDDTFVPNAWRFRDGKLQIAGGFSLKPED